MSDLISCLLCLSKCTDFKCLYGEDGVYDMELYNITVKYFNTMFLAEMNKNRLPVVCLKCWQCMFEFNNFQRLIIASHEKLLRVNSMFPQANEDENVNQNESLTGVGPIDEEGPMNMESITEAPSISSVETTADNYSQLSIQANEKPIEILSSDDESSHSIHLNDIESDREWCEDYEDPVGVFTGGEFDESLSQPPLAENQEQFLTLNNITDIQNNVYSCIPIKEKRIHKTPQKLDDIISKWISIIQCAICQELLPNFAMLRSHTKLKHLHKKCQIACCHRLHVGAAQIAQHAIFHMYPQSFKCELCSKLFTTAENLSRHRRQVHPTTIANASSATPQNKCRMCGKIFVRKDDREEHEANHMGIKMYTCLLCSKTFTYRSCVYRHSSCRHPTEWLNRKTSTKATYTKVNLDDVTKSLYNFPSTC